MNSGKKWEFVSTVRSFTDGPMERRVFSGDVPTASVLVSVKWFGGTFTFGNVCGPFQGTSR